MRYAPTHNMSIEQSRAMFARVLSAWASDMLVLRRCRLDRPSARLARGLVVGRAGHRGGVRRAA